MDRRAFLRTATAVGATALSGSLWREASAAARPGASPYGPLRAPDRIGLQLPAGFSGRVVARSGQLVAGTGYRWHPAPDGGAVFAHADGGWTYVSNSEVVRTGGAGAVRFAADGRVRSARRILSGTSVNCSGGATHWGSWLSCEEVPRGRVFECDPTGARPAVARPAMGLFKHEAAASDPHRRVVYLTEDEPDGCLYRFRPTTWRDLRAGVLEVMVGTGSAVTWERVPDPAATTTPTRRQVAGARRFDGGEGCVYANGSLWFTTKGDGRVWRYDTATSRLSLTYDDASGGSLTGVDALARSRSGDLFVAEDGGTMDIAVITPAGAVAPFLRVAGQGRSEITGPAFSPDGTRLYFSSQRGTTGLVSGGITYEVRGPFRTA